MNSLTDLRPPLPAGELEPRLATEPGRWAVILRHWKTRRALMKLDDAQLRDIGITRTEACKEADKPFWKD